MKSINCAFIASYYGPYYSNFVASIYAFEDVMRQKNCNTIYIFPIEAENFEWIDGLKKKNNKIYFLNYSPYNLDNLKSLRRIFKEEKINLIYSHMCGWDFTAHFAAPRTPIVWHMRMGVNVTDKKKKFKNWLKFNVLGFDKTYHIAVSPAVTEAINSLNPRNKCVTIMNALDFSRLQKNLKSLEPSGQKNILIFGWSPYTKGLDVTLDACEKLISEGKKIKLLVSAQELTYEYINKRYEKTPDWVELLEPTSNVASLYNRADIMLSASRSEGFSFSLAEAIYSGLVTVVSDIPGTSWSSEFAARYEFKSGDFNSLKGALELALDHNITAEEQNNNRHILEDKYSMDIWAEAVYNELNAIVNKRK